MAEETTPEPAAAPKASKLVPALLAVNLLLVATLLVAFLVKGGFERTIAAEVEAAAGAPATPAAVAPGPTTKLPEFVVHLRDVAPERYARVSFEVELGSEEDQAKLAGFMPRVRDAFIAYLSDRTLEDLRGSEAIRRTKSELAEQLTALAPGVRVRALYVTDLVVQ